MRRIVYKAMHLRSRECAKLTIQMAAVNTLLFLALVAATALLTGCGALEVQCNEREYINC